jgi:hypothetical protein
MKDEPAEAAPKPIPSVARDASYLTRSAGVKTGRTRIEQMSSAVHPITDFRRCYLAHFLAASRIFQMPIGTTRTPQKSSRSCRTMNVASVIDRSWRALHGGRLIVFTDSQNRPLTHHRHPGLTEVGRA